MGSFEARKQWRFQGNEDAVFVSLSGSATLVKDSLPRQQKFGAGNMKGS